MSQHKDVRPNRIPLDVGLIGLEERFLTERRTREGGQIVNFDAGWLTLQLYSQSYAKYIIAQHTHLFLCDENSHRRV